MADEGLFPLLLLAGAGYFAWKYFGGPAASPNTANSAAVIPNSTDVTRQSYFSPAMIAPVQPPSQQQQYQAPPQSQTMFSFISPSTIAPTPQRAFIPQSAPFTPPPIQGNYGGAGTMPDMTHYYDAPQAIDSGPVINPVAQAVWTPEQQSFFQRCTYITGALIPGCV